LSKELIDMMQEGLARELTVSIQYMWHHVMAKGLASGDFRKKVKEISIVEMRHAESIAERLDYHNVAPTTMPLEVKVGGDLRQMIVNDLEAERGAIELYKQIIAKADEENDVVTRNLFEDILAAEEDHEAEFDTLLADGRQQQTA
jgi:bacterioferritin